MVSRILATIGLVCFACGRRAAEPVIVEAIHFIPVQPDLFADGGTLTDAWADIDGDGDPDRFVGFNGSASRLYRNDRTGGFVDVAADMGLVVERAVRTSAWGDFDADGDPDLFLGYAREAPVTALYRNDGGSFLNVAAEVGLELAEGTTRQASWVDYDADGDLDLFLAMRDRANNLFRNDGPSGFTDVTNESGLGDARRTVGALWLDADQDGDLDLVAANMDGDANGLWLNDAGHFTDMAAGTPVEAGGRALGDEAQGTVRVCAPDANADGLFDLFFANYGPNALLYATTPGVWSDGSATPSLAVEGHYDTCIWGDADLDGKPDLYVNGTISSGVQYRDWLYRQENDGVFTDVTPPEVLALNASHGATWVDFDMDGDLDLALTGAAPDAMHSLMENTRSPESRRRSLAVRVLDAQGRATRPGAEVRVYVAGTDRLVAAGVVDTGSGYDAQSDLPVYLGLPAEGPVDVAVTVVGSGERRTGTVRTVHPASHMGSALIVRIDSQGRITQANDDPLP
jgi:FG-GAP-like repeat